MKKHVAKLPQRVRVLVGRKGSTDGDELPDEVDAGHRFAYINVKIRDGLKNDVKTTALRDLHLQCHLQVLHMPSKAVVADISTAAMCGAGLVSFTKIAALKLGGEHEIRAWLEPVDGDNVQKDATAAAATAADIASRIKKFVHKLHVKAAPPARLSIAWPEKIPELAVSRGGG